MDLAKIIGSGNVMENFLLGGAKEYRTVVLETDNQRFVLPVTPSKFTVSTDQDNHVVNILDFGENLIAGNTKIKRLKFSGFFPATFHEYSFVVGDIKDAAECVDLITKWKESNALIRVIITDSPVNLLMMIMSFDFKERDGTRDIYFDLEFAEHRNWNVTPANYLKTIDSQTGLKERNNLGLDNILQSSWVRDALDVLDKSKFSYGNFSSLDTFKSNNSISRLSTNFKIGGWKF